MNIIRWSCGSGSHALTVSGHSFDETLTFDLQSDDVSVCTDLPVETAVEIVEALRAALGNTPASASVAPGMIKLTNDSPLADLTRLTETLEQTLVSAVEGIEDPHTHQGVADQLLFAAGRALGFDIEIDDDSE